MYLAATCCGAGHQNYAFYYEKKTNFFKIKILLYIEYIINDVCFFSTLYAV